VSGHATAHNNNGELRFLRSSTYFNTFSFPPTIPIFPTVLMNTAKSVTLTVFFIKMYG
jgi:hypothetical protein